MSDQPTAPPSTSATALPASRSGRPRLLLGLILLAALVAVALMLWRQSERGLATIASQDQLIHRLTLQLRQIEGTVDALQHHLDDTGSAGRSTAGALEKLASQQTVTAQAITDVANTLKAGRSRFQLAAAEELLVLAHDRAVLGGDPRTIATALELAEARLGAIGDARLLAIRKIAAEERLAVLAVPGVDTNSAAVALAALMNMADTLPLSTGIPGEAPLADREMEATELPADSEWPARLWHGLGRALKAVFQIRREAAPIDRLLPPQQRDLVQLMLRSTLESAHLALLQGSGEAWRESLDRALAWLGRYYQAEDARTLAARAELERLRALPVGVRPPVPEKALNTLRALAPAG